MHVLMVITPRNSCLAATTIHLAKKTERPAAISSRLSTFNIGVRCSSYVTLVIRMSSSQLAMTSPGSLSVSYDPYKRERQHSQTISHSIKFVKLSVGVAKGRFAFLRLRLSDTPTLRLFMCYPAAMHLKMNHTQKEAGVQF